jgi:hypothetical protein
MAIIESRSRTSRCAESPSEPVEARENERPSGNEYDVQEPSRIRPYPADQTADECSESRGENLVEACLLGVSLMSVSSQLQSRNVRSPCVPVQSERRIAERDGGRPGVARRVKAPRRDGSLVHERSGHAARGLRDRRKERCPVRLAELGVGPLVNSVFVLGMRAQVLDQRSSRL